MAKSLREDFSTVVAKAVLTAPGDVVDACQMEKARAAMAEGGRLYCCFGEADVKIEYIGAGRHPALVIDNFLCPAALAELSGVVEDEAVTVMEASNATSWFNGPAPPVAMPAARSPLFLHRQVGAARP